MCPILVKEARYGTQSCSYFMEGKVVMIKASLEGKSHLWHLRVGTSCYEVLKFCKHTCFDSIHCNDKTRIYEPTLILYNVILHVCFS